jgi:polysaccharide pyruvyl transferase WcaK-like protein
MTKVFLYGYYGFGNVGDDLLLASIVQRLQVGRQKIDFVVRTLNPVAGLVGEHVEFTCQEQILLRQGGAKLQRLADYFLASWRALAGCRFVVFGGGTLFHARGGSLSNLILILLTVFLARLRGAKVFAIGVGVAEMPAGLARDLMAGILAMLEDFAVRDKTSWENCQVVRGGSRIRRTADLVFSLPMPKSSCLQKLLAGRTIGVTLAASDIGQSEGRYPEFFHTLRTDLAALLADGWKVRLLSFQELHGLGVNVSDSDLLVAIGIAGDGVELIRVSSDPGELCKQFEALDIIIGMRFHGLVLAALLGKPFVGIGRDSKLVDFCRDLGMPFLPMGSVRPGEIGSAVALAFGSALNEEKIVTWQRLAQENFVPLEECLK